MNPIPSNPEPIPDAPYRILVVDDNLAIHDDFRKTLGEDKAGAEFDKPLHEADTLQTLEALLGA